MSMREIRHVKQNDRTLLARFEQRQRKQPRQTTDEALTAKHVQWQAERLSAAAV